MEVSLVLTQHDKTGHVSLHGDVLADGCVIISSLIPFQQELPAVLQVNFLEQHFSVTGDIVSCRKQDSVYMLKFRLHHQDRLQTRMMLQLSEIELYRHLLARKGRHLTIDEAACEWIDKYAESFAREFDA